MGHEFMELKNTTAAIQAYRQAIGSENLKTIIQHVYRHTNK
jgi:hypothetical protein